MTRVASRWKSLGRPVFSHFAGLTREHNALSLAQGAPSMAPPPFVLEAGKRAITEKMEQQYAPVFGVRGMVDCVGRQYTTQLHREATPVGSGQVLVTGGALQALSCFMFAFIDPGDAVVVIDPHFDAYGQNIISAGGVLKAVPLVPSGRDSDGWTVDRAALAAALGSGRVKAMVVNNPQNIPGKVWGMDELRMLSELAIAHDVLVLCDEVYDRLMFDGRKHVSLASLPGMWERTVTVSSMSKTFGVTGWRVGWAVGPEPLIAAMQSVCISQVYAPPTPLQHACAECFAVADTNGYYRTLVERYDAQRDVLRRGLEAAGLRPVEPHGAFFMAADIDGVRRHEYLPVSGQGTGDVGRDWHFCEWLTKTIGVSAIPVTAFCEPPLRGMYEKYARFTFCKPVEELKAACDRLQKLREHIA